MIFSNKYKRRIEVARWKANIKRNEMRNNVPEFVFQQIKYSKQYEILTAQIELLDSLLKGKEIRF